MTTRTTTTAARSSSSRSSAPAFARACSRAVRALVLMPIAVYQKAISPALPRRCKYEPTCSRYAVEAIARHGVLRGAVLAAWRLLRCNPWSDGGYDPVEAQRVFKIHAHTGG